MIHVDEIDRMCALFHITRIPSNASDPSLPEQVLYGEDEQFLVQLVDGTPSSTTWNEMIDTMHSL